MTQLVSKAVGIDLGTTNSAVAVMNRTDQDILLHCDPVTRSLTTPSCVWRGSGAAETVVGRKAFARKGSVPAPISSIKRLMGTRATVDLAGEQLTPQQVSAYILAEMKRQIETDVAGFDTPAATWIVDRAVVTVPAYFDQPQIDATREAAEAAGLDVLSLLHEPTAAASYHCWRTGTANGTFLVYDLGGGTFDVSVLRCTAGSFDVLGISGNNRLGGDDIDDALARHLQSMLQADGWALDLDLEAVADRATFNRIKLLAEGAKKALSQSHEYMLRENGTIRDKAGEPIVIETMIERAELEEIARPFVEHTFPYCDEALARAQERAGITLADVDQVVLAGGSTHMPLVREMVTRELCGMAEPGSNRSGRAKCAEPVYEQVDTVVARGAAVRAAAIGGLAIYDENRTVRIFLRGTGQTGTARHTVGGSAQALVPDVDLARGSATLVVGDYDEETDLAADGSFAFTRVPLQPNAETEITIEVRDAHGDLRATVRRTVAQSAGTKPLGPSDEKAQNTKSIKLEVRHGEQTRREELVKALETLPFAGDFTFRHPGGGVENVELRLFQEGRPIQVIGVQVPQSTPKDALILMHVVMYENYAITVEGSIGDTPYQAKVQVPWEVDEMPGVESAERLRRRFQESISVLPLGKRSVAQARFTMAYRAFEDARDRGDVAQAVHEFAELESIVEAIGQGEDELRPPKAKFDELVAECADLHGYFAERGASEGRHFDAEGIAKSIEEQRSDGERAYTNRNQSSYAEAVQKLEGLREYLVGLLRPDVGSGPSTAERAKAAVEGLVEVAGQLGEQAQRMHDAEAERELAQIGERAAGFGAQIPTDPERVLEEAGKLSARLEQLRLSMGAQDRATKTDVPVVYSRIEEHR
jgi:molecular chaperone DnaK